SGWPQLQPGWTVEAGRDRGASTSRTRVHGASGRGDGDTRRAALVSSEVSHGGDIPAALRGSAQRSSGVVDVAGRRRIRAGDRMCKGGESVAGEGGGEAS